MSKIKTLDNTKHLQTQTADMMQPLKFLNAFKLGYVVYGSVLNGSIANQRRWENFSRVQPKYISDAILASYDADVPKDKLTAIFFEKKNTGTNINRHFSFFTVAKLLGTTRKSQIFRCVYPFHGRMETMIDEESKSMVAIVSNKQYSLIQSKLVF